jgi:hypothetical protein
MYSGDEFNILFFLAKVGAVLIGLVIISLIVIFGEFLRHSIFMC